MNNPSNIFFDDVCDVGKVVYNEGSSKIVVDEIGRTENKKMKLAKNVIFSTFKKLEACIKYCSVKHYIPYCVVHSDIKNRYMVVESVCKVD